MEYDPLAQAWHVVRQLAKCVSLWRDRALFVHRSLSRPLAPYYVPAQKDYVEKDYICSMAKDNGGHLCHSLPNYRIPHTGAICNISAKVHPSLVPEGKHSD